MKKILTSVAVLAFVGSSFAQWTKTSFAAKGAELGSVPKNSRGFYKLDLALLRSQLKDAQEQGATANPVYISLPTMDGRIEKFKIYSFPVMVKELADQYELGSYTGASLENPGKLVRFSVAPNDFQAMIFSNGSYEFIDAMDASKTVYSVHPKTVNTGDKPFVCSTSEDAVYTQELKRFINSGNKFTNKPGDFSKSSDKKYRTMRLALSVTGEYTAAFGGTAGALAQMNATMTRVNGVFEKDLALHLNMQNYPSLIYTDATTDPYSDAASMANWNQELQTTLTNVVGNANYDIGHLFGASGGGGNAGCIGCVCKNPTTGTPLGKGSGITSPGTGLPQGDSFDIDYVAHEMGHQLGANHTFAHALESSGMNVEPGSGTTIMGYAGITGAATDVQAHSDPFFHTVSIGQIQTNLTSKTCDVETAVINTPPVIAALPTYNIPKGTAFVLTGSATDAEGDPLTYIWEEKDNASVIINKTNLGTTATGASFRSMPASTSPVRYFPRLSSVLAGVLNNSNNLWEAVSQVARTTNFAFTVRDNNANTTQQQTATATEQIVVGADGPFLITTTNGNITSPSPLNWNVANTSAAPYNSPNVKIDYTTDNGATWTVLSASTPNDGTENFAWPSSLVGQNVIVRISSIGNVFYAVKNISVSAFANCDGTAPQNIVAANLTFSGATVSWNPVNGATYVIRYKKTTDTNWTTVTSVDPTVTLTGLSDNTTYEVQVAAVCSGTQGAFSNSVNFTTAVITYCTSVASHTDYEFISNVTLANVNNTSLASSYSDYTNTPALIINLTKNNSYTITVTKNWSDGNPDYDAVSAWIDFDRNGVFDSSERILASAVTNTDTPPTATFTVPATAIENLPTRMRVIDTYVGSAQAGLYLGNSCYNPSYGETEDYTVMVTSTLGTTETGAKNELSVYPNPATDFIFVKNFGRNTSYSILDASGRLVSQGMLANGEISVNNLLKGNYILVLKSTDKEQKVKFIKK